MAFGEIIIFIFLIVLIMVYFVTLLLFIFRPDTVDIAPSEFPKVSVLISVRNEEFTITRCLEGLKKLNYPKEKLEILIGDDDSEDNTISKIRPYLNEQIKLVERVEGSGKHFVLAELAKRSKGDYLFFTDADVRVSTDWINSLLSSVMKGVGIVCGVTVVENTGTFAGLQNLEWINAIANLKVTANLGRPLTAFGNNMSVSKEAYDAVGGFDSIPKSITEDFQLFKEITKKGYKTNYCYTTGAKNVTLPEQSLTDLVSQRKRWMFGASRIPLQYQILLFLQSIFLFMAIALSLVNPIFGLLAIPFVLLRAALLITAGHRINESINIFFIPVFEFYLGMVTLATLFSFWFSKSVVWKGRKSQ